MAPTHKGDPTESASLEGAVQLYVSFVMAIAFVR